MRRGPGWRGVAIQVWCTACRSAITCGRYYYCYLVRRLFSEGSRNSRHPSSHGSVRRYCSLAARSAKGTAVLACFGSLAMALSVSKAAAVGPAGSAW